MEIEGGDKRAAEAIELFYSFCDQTRKWIGDNAPQIRARIFSGMQFSGIDLDSERNNANAPAISRKDLCNERSCIAGFIGMDPHTVAKGRRELIEQDFEVARIRKAGGGRKLVEKKCPKSSPESKN